MLTAMLERFRAQLARRKSHLFQRLSSAHVFFRRRLARRRACARDRAMAGNTSVAGAEWSRPVARWAFTHRDEVVSIDGGRKGAMLS